MLQGLVKSQRRPTWVSTKASGNGEVVGRRKVRVPPKGIQSQLFQNIRFSKTNLVASVLRIIGLPVCDFWCSGLMELTFFLFDIWLNFENFLLTFFEVCIFHLYTLPSWHFDVWRWGCSGVSKRLAGTDAPYGEANHALQEEKQIVSDVGGQQQPHFARANPCLYAQSGLSGKPGVLRVFRCPQ